MRGTWVCPTPWTFLLNTCLKPTQHVQHAPASCERQRKRILFSLIDHCIRHTADLQQSLGGFLPTLLRCHLYHLLWLSSPPGNLPAKPAVSLSHRADSPPMESMFFPGHPVYLQISYAVQRESVHTFGNFSFRLLSSLTWKWSFGKNIHLPNIKHQEHLWASFKPASAELVLCFFSHILFTFCQFIIRYWKSLKSFQHFVKSLPLYIW